MIRTQAAVEGASPFNGPIGEVRGGGYFGPLPGFKSRVSPPRSVSCNAPWSGHVLDQIDIFAFLFQAWRGYVSRQTGQRLMVRSSSIVIFNPLSSKLVDCQDLHRFFKGFSNDGATGLTGSLGIQISPTMASQVIPPCGLAYPLHKTSLKVPGS